MLRAILLVCVIVTSQAHSHLAHFRSLSTTISNRGCSNGFDQDDIKETVKNGEAFRHCFKNDVTCLEYKINVETMTDNETAKLLVVIIERGKIESNNVGDRLDENEHYSICSDPESCENKVGVSSRKEYAILVINDNCDDFNFTEAIGRDVDYVIDYSGCRPTSHVLAIILIVFCVIFAVLGCISCFMVRSRRQNKLAQLRQEAGYPQNGPIQFTQMTGTTNPMSPIDSSQQTQSAVPWAIPVDSPSNTAPLPPRF